MSKCVGCGQKANQLYCSNCFKLKNYNKYQKETPNTYQFKESSNNLYILVIDVLNLKEHYDIKNDVFVVINKRDLLKDTSDNRVLEYLYSSNLNIIDAVVISTKNNYHYDDLCNKLLELNYKNNYFIGSTKSGKTSIINKLLYNYQNINNQALVSLYPNITKDIMEYKFGHINLIDTPSLEEDSVINYLNYEQLEIINTSNMKQTVFQLREDTIFNIGDILKIEASKVNISFYFNNLLNIKRTTNNKGKFFEYNLDKDYDLVIPNMGIVRVSNKCHLKIYHDSNLEVFIRKSI